MTNTDGKVVGMMVGEILLDNRDQLGMAVHTCLGLSILSWGSGGLHICRKNLCSHLHVGKIPEGSCRDLMEAESENGDNKKLLARII